jgi:type IV pilus assembly protein PilY1
MTHTKPVRTALAALLAATLASPASAQLLNFSNQPLYVGGAVAPMVMLTMSRDHQLFKKAYNDFSDLNGDGQIETTYNHSIDYYGYFDPYKCYTYDSSNGRFNPTAGDTINDPANRKLCPAGSAFSGNFLNWATMTRIDAVRKLLFGGLRVVDGNGSGTPSNTVTVLERAYLPQTSHAFAKYYVDVTGDVTRPPIDRLTPFSGIPNTPTSLTPSSANVSFNRGWRTISFGSGVAGNNFHLGDQVRLRDTQTPTRFGFGTVTCVNGNRLNLFTVDTNWDGVPDSGGGAPFDPPPAACGNDQITIRLGRVDGATGTVTGANTRVENISRIGITVCNATLGGGDNDFSNRQNKSQTNTNAPLMRVARGNYDLWGTSERWNCVWGDDNLGAGEGIGSQGQVGQAGQRTNANQVAISGLFANAISPVRAASGWGGRPAVGLSHSGVTGDFNVRVRACLNGNEGSEKCKLYPGGQLKPIGLLQIYGETNLIQYGLLTGSFDRNYSGGVLRKNVGSVADEINSQTGQFLYDRDATRYWRLIQPSTSSSVLTGHGGTYWWTGTSGTTGGTNQGNIIGAISNLRLWGYSYADAGGWPSNSSDPTAMWNYGATQGGSFTGSNGDYCWFILPFAYQAEGYCTGWGNPISEMFFESLRYFGGGKAYSGAPSGGPTTWYNAATRTKDNDLGLPAPAWRDPITSTNYCTPLNTLVLNSSVVDHESGEAYLTSSGSNTTKTFLRNITASDFNSALGGTSTIAGQSATYPRTPVGLTNLIGVDELPAIANTTRFIGQTAPSTGNKLCDAKTVGNFGDLAGLCPEGPTTGGTYLVSGLAHHAHRDRIRTDITVPSTANPSSLLVNTFAVALATNTPRFPVQLQGDTAPRAYIQPAYRVLKENGTGIGGGGFVDMRVVNLVRTNTMTSGRLVVSWEDGEAGGDHDQDVVGAIDFCLQTTANQCLRADGSLEPTAPSLTITTQTFAASTAEPQGFGYVISGTTADGPHFHSGVNAFRFVDPTPPAAITIGLGLGNGTSSGINLTPVANSAANTGVSTFLNQSGSCGGSPSGPPTPSISNPWNWSGSDTPGRCRVAQAPVSARYNMAAALTAQPLQDPLWYAAKWGGYKEDPLTGNNRPDSASEWDVIRMDGSGGSDGNPDNYFFVSNPLGLEAALDKSFVAILATSSASSVATNSTSLRSGSRIYQARFNSNDWSGQLLAFTIDLNGVIASTPEWDGGQKINAQAASSRKILSYDDSTKIGIPFQYASMNGTQKAWLDRDSNGTTDSRGTARVTYLRGDATNEGFGVGDFRRRLNSKLGDIVSSNPAYVGPPNQSYPDASYSTFKTTNASRRPVIYVGANDGMLHAFDADPASGTVGQELFAYVPSAVYYKLSRLTGQNYGHRYYVDGTPAVADVFVNGQWRTILVGALGAGGQGLFALDVTNPTAISESTAASSVLWEFTDDDGSGRGDKDLGFSFSQPRIARMANGKWAVIIGNGYNSAYRCTATPCSGSNEPERLDSKDGDGKAKIFILFIEDGLDRNWSTSDYVKLNSNVGDTTATGMNGMSDPLPVDVDGDGMVDFIYAGDLKGNLWKFDVTSSNPSQWGPAFGTTASPLPLYQARDPSNIAQPITTRPEFVMHPQGGYMLMFGTGMYLQLSDQSTTQRQTFYGLWDWEALSYVDASRNPSAGPFTTSVTTRNNTLLQQQTILGTGTLNGDSFRVTSMNSVNWNTQRGWYVDLPTQVTGPSERVAFDPQVRNGKVIVTSLIPSLAVCDSGGDSWMWVLDALTGSGANDAVFDSNNDRIFSSGDLITYGTQTGYASARKSRVGITPTPTMIAGGSGADYAVTSGSSGGRESIRIRFGNNTTVVRRAWREVLRTTR